VYHNPWNLFGREVSRIKVVGSSISFFGAIVVLKIMSGSATSHWENVKMSKIPSLSNFHVATELLVQIVHASNLRRKCTKNSSSFQSINIERDSLLPRFALCSLSGKV
jgi:hypothetical protein